MITGSLAGIRLLFVVNVDWFFISHRLPLLRAAVERGAIVGVATADTGRLDEIAAEGVYTYALPMSRSGTGVREQCRVLWALVGAVRDFRPDVVHNVTIKPVLFGTAVSRLFRRRTRIINAISGFGFAIDGDSSSRLRRAVGLAYPILLRSKRVTVVVQNSDAAALVVQRRIAPADRVEMIEGSGVDCSEFSPTQRRDDGPVRIVMASRILRDKGVVEFCRACAELGPDATAVLAGPLDVEGNPTAMTLAETLELCGESGVEYVGEVADMAGFLKEADVFVLPSYHEGLPKVLIEAAASGLPLVATDIPGCRPVVEQGENGMLVPPRSVEPLAAAIKALVADPGGRSRYGAASRKRAAERFSIEHVVLSFMRLYQLQASR